MAHVKRAFRLGFTQCPNEIFRHGLSPSAIGIYAFIVGRPDEWDFSVIGTSIALNVGRDLVTNAVKLLEKKGFLLRVRTKNAGKFEGSDWIVAAMPFEFGLPEEHTPLQGLPMTAFPSKENAAQIIKKESNKEKVNKENIYKEIFHENGNSTSLPTNLKKEPKEKSCAKKEKVVHDSEWLRTQLKKFYKKFPDKYPYPLGLELRDYYEEGNGNGKIRLQEKKYEYFEIGRRLASFWRTKSEWQKEKLWEMNNEKFKNEERYEQSELFTELAKQTTPQY